MDGDLATFLVCVLALIVVLRLIFKDSTPRKKEQLDFFDFSDFGDDD